MRAIAAGLIRFTSNAAEIGAHPQAAKCSPANLIHCILFQCPALSRLPRDLRCEAPSGGVIRRSSKIRAILQKGESAT
jgi:hypothetical protein